MVFMPSGFGKDRALFYMKKCFEEVSASIETRVEGYITDTEETNTQHAENQDWSAKRVRGYIADNTPYYLSDTIGDATPEGLLSLRKEFEKAEFGSLHFSNSEFIDYICTKDANKIYMISLLKDAFEEGNNPHKMIKSSKVNNAVSGVPQTMLVHSSLSGLLENEGANQTLKDFFNRGLARRSFVCYPNISKAKLIRNTSDYSEHLLKAQQLFSKVFKNTQKNNIIGVPQDVVNTYRAYEEYNFEMASKIKDYEYEAKRSELMDRHRKSLRMAAIIAIFSRPDDVDMDGKYNITAEDFELAREQVEFYSQQFKALYERKAPSDATRIYDLLKKKEMSKGEIGELPLAPTNSNKKTFWLDNTIDAIETLCSDRGDILEKNVGKYNKQTFKIISYDDADKKTQLQGRMRAIDAN